MVEHLTLDPGFPVLIPSSHRQPLKGPVSDTKTITRHWFHIEMVHRTLNQHANEQCCILANELVFLHESPEHDYLLSECTCALMSFGVCIRSLYNNVYLKKALYSTLSMPSAVALWQVNMFKVTMHAVF